MRYFSVCSGIECFSVAVKGLGYEPVAFAEIERFPSAVLDYHYPETVNIGDFTNKDAWPDDFDLLVGGTPCQSFSVAGLRKGLEDERGNLTLEYFKILRDRSPKWFIWENVPGTFSAGRGRDLRLILDAFAFCGYCVSWRIFNAQYFGVPQRRRRIFVVGSFGNERAGKVLFEQESLRGDIKTGKKTRKKTAGEVSKCLTGKNQRIDYETETFVFGTIDANINAKCGSDQLVDSKQYIYENHGTNERVRRLTPLECERLQGLPDNYTRIPYNGKQAEKCPDAPRYAAIGNGMAVPVMRWIAKRIQEAEKCDT